MPKNQAVVLYTPTCYNRPMESTNDVKIIAFVGMPGAGKSSAVDYISQRGYPTVYFGGVVLQAIKDAGLPVTPANEKRMRQQLRQDEGKDVIVKRISQQIRQLIAEGHSRIVADGLYSWTEYTYLQRAFPGQLYVMAIIAPRGLRHQRLAQRPERPLTPAEALDRDYAEIENVEKGGPIAIADHYIMNTGSLEDLHTSIERELTASGI